MNNGKTTPLKSWVLDEAAREGLRPTTIYNRLSKRRYPKLRLKRFNARVILVLNPDEADHGWRRRA